MILVNLDRYIIVTLSVYDMKSVASKYSLHIPQKNFLKPTESFDVYKCKIGCKIVLLLLNVFGESFVKVIRSLLMKVGPQICNLIAKLGSS